MTPTEPKPGDLGLFVRAGDVPEKCEVCNGVGSLKWPAYPPRTCDACNGSGTRKVTLEGWVKLNQVGNEDVFTIEPDGVEWELSFVFCENITKDIIAMLHDGTCPEEIGAQLHEVES